MSDGTYFTDLQEFLNFPGELTVSQASLKMGALVLIKNGPQGTRVFSMGQVSVTS